MCWARPEYRGAVSPPRKFPAKVPAAARARYAKRRKNRLARVDNDLTAAQWADLLTAWGDERTFLLRYATILPTIRRPE